MALWHWKRFNPFSFKQAVWASPSPAGKPTPPFLTSKRLPLPRGTRQEEAYGMDFRLQIDMPNFGGQNMQKKYNSQLVPFARQLRSEMTKEERHLWYDFLRTYPIRFSRQKVLGKYIADFYSGTYACTARFGVGVDAYIDPADCTVFTVICGEFATSRRADVGIGPYRVLREFTAAHRADRGVRPYASLGNPTQNRKTIVFCQTGYAHWAQGADSPYQGEMARRAKRGRDAVSKAD